MSLIFLLGYASHSQDTIKEDVKYTREIKKLANKKEVKTAFQVILDLEPKTIKNQIELTEIEAPPFKEEKINVLLEFLLNLKILKTNGVIIIHRNKKINEVITEKLNIIETRDYGISKIILGN